MTGTEKQINWAEDIKAQFEAKLWRAVEEANERVKDGSMPPEWAAAVYDAQSQIKASVINDSRDLAKLWIEHRDRIMGFAEERTVNLLADKLCPSDIRLPALNVWRAELGMGVV